VFDSWLYFLALGALLVLLCLVAPPLLAARKGYTWYLWTLACGVFGLLMLAFLPSTNNPQVGEQVNRSRRQLGNTVGAVLSALGLLGILFLAWEARPREERGGGGRGGSGGGRGGFGGRGGSGGDGRRY
jgi:uncharacterized membrane protein YgcG